MRFLKTLAGLLAVLIAFGGAPRAAAVPDAIRLEAIGAHRLPADAAVARDSARAGIAAAWRALQTHPGIVPGGIVAREVASSRVIALASGASVVVLAFPSSSLRGPPPVV